MITALAVAWTLQQGEITLRGAQGEFVVRNFSSFTLPYGPGTITAKGNPAQALWRDAGLNVEAQSFTVKAAQAGGNYFLESAEITGNASITLDSAVANEYRTAHNLPLLEGSSKLTFVSPALSYAGTSAAGTLTVPHDFRGTMAAEGTEGDRAYKETMETTGSSATIAFSIGADPRKSLRTGTIGGPVLLHLVRNTTTAGKPDPATDLTVRGDRLDMDFVSPEHTIKLEGNVQLDGTTEGYTGNAKAAHAVLVLGPHNELLELRMSGNPTETKVKPGGGR